MPVGHGANGRMIANGDAAVNAIRAERSAAVKLTSSRVFSGIPQIRGQPRCPMDVSSPIGQHARMQ